MLDISSTDTSISSKGALLFRFAVVADSHLNPSGHGNTSPWQTNHLANARNEVVVDAINRLCPAFTVHVGDVVHPLPHSADYAGAAHFANGLYGRLAAPFYIAPGNHDIGDKCLPGNPAATISESSCSEYEAHFGAQWQSFLHGDLCFVIVNSCLFGSDSKAEHDQWRWLEQTLVQNRHRRIFFFTHYPPYITHPAEEDHYDNIDSGPRQALIALLTAHGVEGLFAGHVHTFFLNRFGATWAYALPSSTNFRQDYAELFRVDPAEELGRNDLGKFGFFLVDVHETGHVARFVRTYGSVERADAQGIVTQIGLDIRSSSHVTVGVDLCHDWTSVTALPYNPPLDTFLRKKVRNDYPILNLWDCGVRNIRVPLQDIMEPDAFERVRMVVDLGHDLTVFCVGLPPPKAIDRLVSLGHALRALEMVTDHDLGAMQFGKLPESLRRVAFAAPFYVPEQAATGVPFDHTMACGIPTQDLRGIVAMSARLQALSSPVGLLVRIGQHQPVIESLAALIATRPDGMRLMVNVRITPDKSYQRIDDDRAIAARVAEAALCALLYPDVVIRIDTFMDIDRGYFPRNGVVDRRHNPRLAGVTIRDVGDRLGRVSDLRITSIRRDAGVLSIDLASSVGPTTLSISSRPGEALLSQMANKRPDRFEPVIAWGHPRLSAR